MNIQTQTQEPDAGVFRSDDTMQLVPATSLVSMVEPNLKRIAEELCPIPISARKLQEKILRGDLALLVVMNDQGIAAVGITFPSVVNEENTFFALFDVIAEVPHGYALIQTIETCTHTTACRHVEILANGALPFVCGYEFETICADVRRLSRTLVFH